MPRIDFAAQTVLITGASSGIGEAFARELAARGADLVVVARRRDRLERLAHELRSTHGVAVTPVVKDLSSPTAGVELRQAVSDAGIRVTGVINNAGFGTFGPFIEDDRETLAREIAVDIGAPVQIAREFLPELVAAGSGFLVNVGSMAGFNPTPRMSVYGAAKAFLLSFTESLWAESRASGVTVFLLAPGATSTEFNSVVGTDDATAGARMRTPEDVVRTALTHLEHRNPGPIAIDGTGNRFAARLARALPRRTVADFMYRLTDPARRAERATR
jgi:uncharacterized protein